jgi:protein-disulfide isomerase
MSDLIFANRDDLGDGDLRSFAAKAGLDGDAMLRLVYSGRYDPVIDRHRKEGREAGVRATPTLFFNGRQYALPIKLEFLVFSAQDEDEWQRNKGGWDKD